ncbi:hypothetical protein H8356DRAFT_947713, partial [Neocallimastix lanati (nom. inval.)]
GDGNQWHKECHHHDNNERKQDSAKDTSMIMVIGLDYSNSSDLKLDQQMTGKNKCRRESDVNSL